MRPVSELRSHAAAVEIIFTDIDGTLTDHGKLGPEAYAALWQLRRAGKRVVPVTGRPAGWCDLIARQWPVDAVVGENGALAYWEEGGKLHRMEHPEAQPAGSGRLDQVRQAVLAEVPGSRVAPDQAFRRYDLAIDFAEDEPVLGLDAAADIQRVFERFGAHAKISNIHVNGWFGDYDKLSMVRRLVQHRFGWELDQGWERVVFCGDSPNDEPMFAAFPLGVGVQNISVFAAQLRSPPAYVTPSEGGKGFAELTEVLLG